MVEYVVLRIFYVPIPFLFPGEEEIIHRINYYGARLINNISLQFGYRFTGAAPAGEDFPCQGPFPCFDLWFRKEGSPALPVAAIIGALVALGLYIVIIFVTYYIYKIEENKMEALETVTQTAEKMFEMCIKQGGSPEVCRDIVSDVTQKLRPGSTLEDLVKPIVVLIAVGIGGFVLIEVLRMWRRG